MPTKPKYTLEPTSTTRPEFAVYMNGQLIGYIAKIKAKIWFVRGMGEQLSPISVNTKWQAIAMLVECAEQEAATATK